MHKILKRVKKDGPPFFASCTVNNSIVGVPTNPYIHGGGCFQEGSCGFFQGLAKRVISRGCQQW